MDALKFDLQTAFYDIMFNDGAQEAGELNELETLVCNEVGALLEHSSDFSALVPSLPDQLIKIVDVLGSETSDFDQIGEILHGDILLAGEVVNMANSPYFRRTSQPVESLTQAVQLIGLEGVADLATTVLAQRLIEIKPIYFKLFGQQIWVHSKETAIACRALAGNFNPSLCYFLGLVHDVGKVVVFKCLLDSFSSVDPSSRPGSKLFKQQMTDYSNWLSWRVVDEWQVPRVVVDAIKQQRLDQKDKLAEKLYICNLCSEIHMLIRADRISFEDGKSYLLDLGLPEETLFTIYDEIELDN